MGACHLLQRVEAVNLDLDLARCDQTKELGSVLLPLLRRNEIITAHGPQQLDILGSKLENVDRWHRARLEGSVTVSTGVHPPMKPVVSGVRDRETYRIAERNDRPLASNHLQVRVKGRLSNTIQDHVYSPALGDGLCPRGYVFFLGVDDKVGTALLGQGALLGVARGADHVHAKGVQDLDHQAAGAARRGVDERPRAVRPRRPRRDARGFPDEGQRREALEHGGRGGLERYAVGDVKKRLGGGHRGELRVRGPVHVHDAVPDLESRHRGVRGHDGAGRFLPGYPRVRGRLVETGSEVSGCRPESELC